MAETIAVTVCFSPAARVVCELSLQLPIGGTLQQAVTLAMQQPQWPQDWPEAACMALSPGIWGRKSEWQAELRTGDRVELYRPLRVDPKLARRQRFGQQGARRAGLFAKKRPGAAAGY
jgi:putative ubiquitin-RnfH superfamily antitoxin RatB of RatAB toxin-antitoxin module